MRSSATTTTTALAWLRRPSPTAARSATSPKRPAAKLPSTANGRITGPVAAGDQILWDWPNGRLIIDTPTAKGYAGPAPSGYRFSDGIVLGDVSGEFVSFFMVSADGKPLVGPGAAERIFVTAVFDAQNTGFDFDWSVRGGPAEQARAVRNAGRLPVVVDHVPYTLWFPTEIEGHFEGFDFALRRVVNRPIAGTNQFRHDGRDLFMGVLTVEQRGEFISDAEVPTLYSASADVEVDFRQRKMSAITVTFKDLPPFADVVADHEAKFGPASDKRQGMQFENSFANWPATPERPAIRITESQGILKILYAVDHK